MNNNVLCLLISAAIGVSGCTFNVGTGNNAGNAPASNLASSAQPANNSASSPGNAVPTSDAAESSRRGGDDPKASDEQIQFPRGSTDVTLERTIAPGVNKMYTFNAKKGQTLWFKVSEGSNALDVDFNKRPVKVGEEVRESLNASGEWAIYLSNPTGKAVLYTLWIGIE